MTEQKASPQLAGTSTPVKRTDFLEMLPELDAGVFSAQVGVALTGVPVVVGTFTR